MSCPYYGKSSPPGNFGIVPTGGNQCALITEAHSPCRMEIKGDAPDFEHCELKGSARQADVDGKVAAALQQEFLSRKLFRVTVVVSGPDRAIHALDYVSRAMGLAQHVQSAALPAGQRPPFTWYTEGVEPSE